MNMKKFNEFEVNESNSPNIANLMVIYANKRYQNGDIDACNSFIKSAEKYESEGIEISKENKELLNDLKTQINSIDDYGNDKDNQEDIQSEEYAKNVNKYLFPIEDMIDKARENLNSAEFASLCDAISMIRYD